MILSDELLRDRETWEAKGYLFPKFDREEMIQRTKKNPVWLHFGPGNIFKALHGMAVQRLLNEGVMDRGIIAVERMPGERGNNDGLSVVVTLKSDGTMEKTVLGSIAETCYLYGDESDWQRLTEIFCSPSLQMITFTITEKGYRTDGDELLADLTAAPPEAKSYMGKVVSLLLARFRAGAYPVAMVSQDNCAHNGDRLKAVITAFAEAWGDAGFLSYVRDGAKVSFPWTMIDKITPSPNPAVGAVLTEDGLEDCTPVQNERGTVRAPYVNAEVCEYLVIEDDFPNGRPDLGKAGFFLTDRETVDRVERMKVCTCLNPLHTALAIFGCLLGYEHIWQEMQDEDLSRLVFRIGYEEGLPVVTDPGIIRPEEFLETVIKERFPNPFLPDTPQRIATDTSQKLTVRFGETVKAYLDSDTLKVEDLSMIPLVYAGWLRYLMAKDDRGEDFTPSPDPLLKKAGRSVDGLRLGEKADPSKLEKLLKNQDIFGVDLVAAGLSDKILGYFAELTEGVGAVRKTLHKYVNQNKEGR